MVSQSQEFCARCWNNIPPKDQYMLQTSKEALSEAKIRWSSAVARCVHEAYERL